MDMVEQGSANEQTDEIIRGVRQGEEDAKVAKLLRVIKTQQAAAATAAKSNLHGLMREFRHEETIWREAAELVVNILLGE